MLKMTLRHMRRHWSLNLVLLAGMLIGSTLLAGLPLVAAMIAAQSLSQSLEDATVPLRNMALRGDALTPEALSQLEVDLGPLFRERVAFKDVQTSAAPIIYRADGREEERSENLIMHLWSFDPFDELVEVVEGRLPGAASLPLGEDSVVEAAIGLTAAQALNLGLGDELLAQEVEIRVRIVGLVNPSQPDSEIWWGDSQMTPFNTLIFSNSDFDRYQISILLPSSTLDVMPVVQTERYWRVLLNREGITVNTAQPVLDQLLRIRAFAVTDTGLIDLLQRYHAQLGPARLSLFLLTVQSLLAVLFTLGMLSAFLLDQSQFELGTLAGRGFSPIQITGIFAVQGAILAFGLALPLGPLLAHAGVQWWSDRFGGGHLLSIPPESWMLAFIAVTFSWLALVIPLFLATRKNLLAWLRQRARPESDQVPLRRFTFDFYLLILGGLAYWQLTQLGTLSRDVAQNVDQAVFGVADPVLLLGPTVLLLAIGLLFLRFFPFLLLIAAWFSKWVRGLILPLGLTHLARGGGSPSRVVLLISLTASLAFFATVFQDSLTSRQRAMGRYINGADLRIAQPIAPAEANTVYGAVIGLPGVNAVSPVYRGQARFDNPQTGASTLVNLLAVDPISFPQISDFPSGITTIRMEQLMGILEPVSPEVLPAIISADLHYSGLAVPGEVEYQIGREKYRFLVRGIIVNFPNLSPPYIITHLPSLERQLDLTRVDVVSTGQRELWIAAEANRQTEIADRFGGQLLGNSQERLRVFQSNLISQETVAALQLNTIILVILSSASFLLIQIFAARSRRHEFSVLRAMGVTTGQLMRLLTLEGVIMMLVGLVAGVGIGYGLAAAMRPFLSLTLAASLGNSVIDQLTVNWFNILQIFAVLIGFYGLALLLLLIGLQRKNLGQVLQLGNE